MATSNQYGTTSPAAIDPFQIESVLAQIVGQNNPAEAANMLDTYQIQRATSEGNYNYALQGQHDFARDQLAQQLKEQYIKSAMDAVQHPGGLSVLRAMAPDALANVDPSIISSTEGGLTNLQRAETFEKGASGAYHAVQAGFPPNAASLANLTGGITGAQGTPLQMQIEAMKEGAANARAGAANAQATEPTRNIKVMGPHGEESWGFTGRQWRQPGAVDARLDEAGIPRINAGAPESASLPPAAQALAPQPPGRPSVPATRTNVPSAPPSARPPQKPMTPAPNNTQAGVVAMQDAVVAKIENFKGHPGYADVKAGMAANDGRPIVRIDPATGRPTLYGASGRPV
jgi:hypothetical protein